MYSFIYFIGFYVRLGSFSYRISLNELLLSWAQAKFQVFQAFYLLDCVAEVPPLVYSVKDVPRCDPIYTLQFSFDSVTLNHWCHFIVLFCFFQLDFGVSPVHVTINLQQILFIPSNFSMSLFLMENVLLVFKSGLLI